MKTLIFGSGWHKTSIGLAVALLCGFGTNLQAVNFTEIARFDISATGNPTVAPGDPIPPPDSDFVGVNAVKLAYNGTKLYLAGFNNSGAIGETSIVEITNPTATGLVTPTFGVRFGTDPFGTPPSRGFSGLALSPDGTKLAAAYDDGVSNSDTIIGPAPTGLQVFDTSTNSQQWQYAERGGSGVAFDPGFPGGNAAQGTGVAYVESFGSGRRALLNATTGTDIWTPADGMIWIPDGATTGGNTRDIAFDPATGDMYIRSTNDLYFADRSGDNATTQANNVKIVDATDAPFINYQHVGFMNSTSDGKLLIYNDRSSGATGQDFFTVNKLVDPTGAAKSMDFTWLPNADTTAFLPNTGAGWYDYDFDPITQTLALLDTSNRNVHIFQVGSGVVPNDNADFNNNGLVEGADFLAWQRNFGLSGGATSMDGDANGDQNVNAADLAIWQTQYGTSPAMVAAIGAVPEPSSLVLVLCGLAACGCGRRRG